MSDATVAADTNRQPSGPRRPRISASWPRDWWDPKGSSAMLHRLNPVRLGFIREAIDLHWGGDPRRACAPLAGKRALDVGCGAGLLCEPLARLGAEVTGVDAAPENVAAAARACRRARAWRSTTAHGELGALGLGTLRPRHLHRGARARRRQAARSSPQLAGAPGARRADGALDPQPHRRIAAAAGRRGRGARHDPARHARLGRLRHPRRAARPARRGRAGDGRAARHRLVAGARACTCRTTWRSTTSSRPCGARERARPAPGSSVNTASTPAAASRPQPRRSCRRRRSAVALAQRRGQEGVLLAQGPGVHPQARRVGRRDQPGRLAVGPDDQQHARRRSRRHSVAISGKPARGEHLGIGHAPARPPGRPRRETSWTSRASISLSSRCSAPTSKLWMNSGASLPSRPAS